MQFHVGHQIKDNIFQNLNTVYSLENSNILFYPSVTCLSTDFWLNVRKLGNYFSSFCIYWRLCNVRLSKTTLSQVIFITLCKLLIITELFHLISKPDRSQLFPPITWWVENFCGGHLTFFTCLSRKMATNLLNIVHDALNMGDFISRLNFTNNISHQNMSNQS